MWSIFNAFGDTRHWQNNNSDSTGLQLLRVPEFMNQLEVVRYTQTITTKNAKLEKQQIESKRLPLYTPTDQIMYCKDLENN